MVHLQVIILITEAMKEGESTFQDHAQKGPSYLVLHGRAQD